jgi:hypothetical protein
MRFVPGAVDGARKVDGDTLSAARDQAVYEHEDAPTARTLLAGGFVVGSHELSDSSSRPA